MLRVPIAYPLLAAGIVGIGVHPGLDVVGETAASTALSTPTSYTFLVIALYIVIGILARESQIGVLIFSWLARLLRPLPGGLSIG